MTKNIIYKSVDLFGNEAIHIIDKKKKSNKTLFDDYEVFVDKYNRKNEMYTFYKTRCA